MIHSLSGGSIKDVGNHTFVKIEREDQTDPLWLICDGFKVDVGSTVVFEDKRGWLKRAQVILVDRNVSGQTPPIPLNRIGKALKVE